MFCNLNTFSSYNLLTNKKKLKKLAPVEIDFSIKFSVKYPVFIINRSDLND